MKKLLFSLTLAAMALPAVSAEVTISILPSTSKNFNLNTSTGDKTNATGGFSALVETDSDPMVSMRINNIGTGANKVLNNLCPNATNDSYNMYAGNGVALIAEYELWVPSGYVIKSVSATLYSIDGLNIPWIIDDREEVTSSAEGTEFSVDCDSQYVYLYPDYSDVKPTEWADFKVVVASLDNGSGDEEPGEAVGDEIVIDTAGTTYFRYLSGNYIENDPAAFFAKIETLDDPVVTIECTNIGAGELPILNDIAKSDNGWYVLYGGNGGANIPEYLIYVPDGYVITKVAATLYSLSGKPDVNWYFDNKMFTSSSAGTQAAYYCESKVVVIGTDDMGVNPSEWADFIVTVAKEDSTAVKAIESVEADGQAVYYDLQGRKVANPSNGIFIRQQGSSVSKVFVR